MKPHRYIGQSLLRKEDRRLLTGAGRYAADVRLPGMLCAAVLRSQEAHARIVAIDTKRGIPNSAVGSECAESRRRGSPRRPRIAAAARGDRVVAIIVSVRAGYHISPEGAELICR